MAQKFEDVLKQLREDQIQAQKESTLRWYLDQIKTLATRWSSQKEEGEPDTDKVQEELHQTIQQDKLTHEDAEKELQENVIETISTFNPAVIGKMLFYSYDPKLKATLPYYDTFPLVFLFSVHEGSSIGMNLHYLPPYERARLMTALYSLANSTEPNPNTKLLMTYKVLKESSKYIYFKPCIKKYLHSHIRSRVMVINPLKWNRTLFLPLANFVKAPEIKVWQDSINIIEKSSNNRRILR